MPLPRSISQTTLRRLPFLLWGLSLALAGILAWNLVSNLGSRRDGRSRIAEFERRTRTDLARLRSRLNRVKLRNPGRNGLRDMATASMQLRPLRPRVIEASSVASEDGSDDEERERIADGGPLAEDWEYAGGVFVADDPSRSRVWLRKKEDASAAARRRARYRRTRASRRSRRVRGRSISRSSRDQNIVSFYADEDRFEDEDLKLDFLVRWVDWNKIVYSRPEAPGTEYVLERVDDSPYSFSEEKRLEPFLEDEEAEDDESENDEETKHFRVRARGYINRVEEDYQRLLHDGDGGADPGLDL